MSIFFRSNPELPLRVRVLVQITWWLQTACAYLAGWCFALTGLHCTIRHEVHTPGKIGCECEGLARKVGP